MTLVSKMAGKRHFLIKWINLLTESAKWSKHDDYVWCGYEGLISGFPPLPPVLPRIITCRMIITYNPAVARHLRTFSPLLTLFE